MTKREIETKTLELTKKNRINNITIALETKYLRINEYQIKLNNLLEKFPEYEKSDYLKSFILILEKLKDKFDTINPFKDLLELSKKDNYLAMDFYKEKDAYKDSIDNVIKEMNKYFRNGTIAFNKASVLNEPIKYVKEKKIKLQEILEGKNFNQVKVKKIKDFISKIENLENELYNLNLKLSTVGIERKVKEIHNKVDRQYSGAIVFMS